MRPTTTRPRIKEIIVITTSIILSLLELAVFYGLMIIKSWAEAKFDVRDNIIFLAYILVVCGFNYLILKFGFSRALANRWFIVQLITFVLFWIGLTQIFF